MLEIRGRRVLSVSFNVIISFYYIKGSCINCNYIEACQKNLNSRSTFYSVIKQQSNWFTECWWTYAFLIFVLKSANNQQEDLIVCNKLWELKRFFSTFWLAIFAEAHSESSQATKMAFFEKKFNRQRLLF